MLCFVISVPENIIMRSYQIHHIRMYIGSSYTCIAISIETGLGIDQDDQLTHTIGLDPVTIYMVTRSKPMGQRIIRYDISMIQT